MMMLPPDPIYIFKGEMDSIMCITSKVSSSIDYLFAGTVAGKIHVWNLKTMREIGNFKSGDDACLSINLIEDENESILIAQSKQGKISFWKEKDSNWILLNKINTDFFGFCKSCLFKDILYTSLKDSRCLAISVKTQQKLKTIKFSDANKLGDIMAIKLVTIHGQECILIAYEGNQIFLWDIKEVKILSKLQMSECPMALDYSVETNKGVCGSPSNEVIVFSIGKNMTIKTLKTITLKNAGVASVQIRPDNKLVAIGCWDSKIRLYSWKSFTLLAVLDIHSSTIQDICFIRRLNNNGKESYLLAAGSQDSRVSLWDIYN